MFSVSQKEEKFLSRKRAVLAVTLVACTVVIALLIMSSFPTATATDGELADPNFYQRLQQQDPGPEEENVDDDPALIEPQTVFIVQSVIDSVQERYLQRGVMNSVKRYAELQGFRYISAPPPSAQQRRQHGLGGLGDEQQQSPVDDSTITPSQQMCSAISFALSDDAVAVSGGGDSGEGAAASPKSPTHVLYFAPHVVVANPNVTIQQLLASFARIRVSTFHLFVPADFRDANVLFLKLSPHLDHKSLFASCVNPLEIERLRHCGQTASAMTAFADSANIKVGVLPALSGYMSVLPEEVTKSVQQQETSVAARDGSSGSRGGDGGGDGGGGEEEDQPVSFVPAQHLAATFHQCSSVDIAKAEDKRHLFDICVREMLALVKWQKNHPELKGVTRAPVHGDKYDSVKFAASDAKHQGDE